MRWTKSENFQQRRYYGADEDLLVRASVIDALHHFRILNVLSASL